MATERDYERALASARYLVGAHLDDDLDLRREIVRVMRSKNSFGLLNMLEVLIMAVGDQFDSLDDFSAHVVPALREYYEGLG